MKSLLPLKLQACKYGGEYMPLQKKFGVESWNRELKKRLTAKEFAPIIFYIYT